MISRKASSVMMGASIITVGMFLSRLLGLYREHLMANAFGISNTVGAFNLAFVVPDLFYNLLAGGAMSAAFIPIFTSYLSHDQHEEAHETGSTIATFLLIAMTVCVLICIIFAPQLIGMLQLLQPNGHTLSKGDIAQTVSLMRIMCWMLIFTAQSGHFTGILNSYKHFVTPVAVWLVYNICIILGIGVFSKMALFGGSPRNPNIHAVAYSVVIGAVLLALIQLPVVIKFGFRFRIALNFAHEGVRKVLKLFLPVMVSLSLSQINLLLLPIILGTIFGLPAVSAIRSANRLVLLPLGLFAIAIATAAFPKLAQQAAWSERVDFQKTLSQSTKMIMLLCIPSCMVLFVLAEPITFLLFGGGKFDPQAAHASVFVLMFFAWGLLGLGILQIINRGFYAMHDTLTPTIVSICMVLANFGLSLYLAHHDRLGMRYASVAFATTITTTLAAIVQTELLRRRLGRIDGRALTITLGKCLLATFCMGIVLYVCATVLAPTLNGDKILPAFRWPAPPLPYSIPADPQNTHLFKIPTLGLIRMLLDVGVSIAASAVAYLGMLRILKVPEMSFIIQRFSGKLHKRKVAV